MYIFKKYKYCSSFKAGNSVSNYRTPTGVIDHETCTDNFLYRQKHQVSHNGTVEEHPNKSLNILIIRLTCGWLYDKKHMALLFGRG